MYKDLYDSEFDFVVFGTSLTESTLTAYLSKLGKKVIVIDIASTYGGDCKNFNLREFERCKSTSNNLIKYSFKGIKRGIMQRFNIETI